MVEYTLFIRRGGALIPTDQRSGDAFSKIKDGATVQVALKRARNERQLRLYWSLVGLIFDHQTRYATRERLSDAIKIAVGWCDEYVLKRGDSEKIVVQPRSIDFANCAQDEFEQFFESVTRMVFEEMLPNVSREDLKREIESMVGAGQFARTN